MPAWESNLEQLDLGPLQQAFRQAGKPLDRQKMRSLKLIKTEQGREYPSHGLMILLGRYDQVEIKCSRFKGTDMQRTGTYEIPIPAIREALNNAVVHRDYSNARPAVAGGQG